MSPRSRSSEFTTSNKSEKEAKRKKLLRAGVGVVAATAVGLGMAGCADGEKGTESTGGTPVATSTENPGDTPGDGTDTDTTTSEEPTKTQKKNVDSMTHENDPEYIPEPIEDWMPEGIVEVLDQATPEEFERYPVEDRNQYVGELLAKQTEDDIKLDVYLMYPIGGTRTDGSARSVEDAADIYTPLTKDSSAKAVLQSFLYSDAMRNIQTEGDLRDGDQPLDHEAFRKLTSGMFADPASSLYKDQSTTTYNETYRIEKEYVDGLALVDSGEVEEKESFDGVVRPHMEMIYETGKDKLKSEFVFVAFKNDIEVNKGAEILYAGENGRWLEVTSEKTDQSVV